MDQPDDYAIQRDWFPDHIQGVSKVPKTECVADLEAMQAAAASHATTTLNEIGNYTGESLIGFLAPSLRNHFSLRTNEELKHQSKKARLVEKLLREANPYHLLRQEHTTLRATLDQIRVDTVNYQDAIIQTKKEASLAVRERDIYERQFQVLRKEFCDAMSATMAIRNQYEGAIRAAQAGLEDANIIADTTYNHLADVRELVGRIRRLEAEKESVVVIGEQLRRDVEQLQALLQHCAELAFDNEGNPVMPYCAVFRTMSDEGLMRIRALMREKIGVRDGKIKNFEDAKTKEGEKDDAKVDDGNMGEGEIPTILISSEDNGETAKVVAGTAVDVATSTKDAGTHDASTGINTTATSGQSSGMKVEGDNVTQGDAGVKTAMAPSIAVGDGSPAVSVSMAEAEDEKDGEKMGDDTTADMTTSTNTNTGTGAGKKRKADGMDESDTVKTEKTSTTSSSSSSPSFFPYYMGATPTGIEGLTSEQAAKLTPLERAQRLDLLCQHQNIVDLTGVFHPGVYFELLRKQADQIIDLQRQCTAEAIKAQEGNEHNTLYQQRMQTVGLHLEETLRQLDAAHTEMVLRDGMTTVHGLEMQALQEQAALLRMTLKQVEVVKVLDEKKYQKLLEVLDAADNRATVAEDAVTALMDRMCILQQANDVLQAELITTTEERDALAEMVVDMEEDHVGRVGEAEELRVLQASAEGDVDQLKAALRAALNSNRALKQELAAEKALREQLIKDVMEK